MVVSLTSPPSYRPAMSLRAKSNPPPQPPWERIEVNSLTADVNCGLPPSQESPTVPSHPGIANIGRGGVQWESHRSRRAVKSLFLPEIECIQYSPRSFLLYHWVYMASAAERCGPIVLLLGSCGEYDYRLNT